jgi:hypothetical protein
MPLLEIAPTKKVVATITLEETTALNVDKYAAFVNANADDVVSQALSYVFTRDKDFQKFLEAPDGRKAPHVYAFGITRQSVAESQQQKHSTKAREHSHDLSNYMHTESAKELVMQSELLGWQSGWN